MTRKWFLPIVLGISLLLVVPAFSQTEDEMVAKFLKKAEADTKGKTQLGYVYFNGTYGRLKNANDYNQFADGLSPLISGIDGSYDHIDGIFRSKEFSAGLGYMVARKIAVSAGLTYWLKMGNTPVGDYDFSAAFPTDTSAHTGFELKSEVQVYGFATDVHYYLVNQPSLDGAMNALAVKLSVGGGYYFARWSLWENYLGYNLSTGDYEEIGGKLTGSAPGVTVGASFEYPIKLAGLVVEGGAQYQYLNFTNMKWYNDQSQETVVVHQGTRDRVKLDFSGPRAQFGLKRYFNW